MIFLKPVREMKESCATDSVVGQPSHHLDRTVMAASRPAARSRDLRASSVCGRAVRAVDSTWYAVDDAVAAAVVHTLAVVADVVVSD